MASRRQPDWSSIMSKVNRVDQMPLDLCRELDETLTAAETPSAEALALHEAVLNLAVPRFPGVGGFQDAGLRASSGAG